MICPNCKKENMNEYATVCAYCKQNLYQDKETESKAEELIIKQKKEKKNSVIKIVMSVVLAVVIVVVAIIVPKPKQDTETTTKYSNDETTTFEKQDVFDGTNTTNQGQSSSGASDMNMNASIDEDKTSFVSTIEQTEETTEETTTQSIVTTTKENELIFNPSVEVIRAYSNGYRGSTNGDIVDDIPYYYSFFYDIKDYRVEETTIIFNCQITSIYEEIMYDDVNLQHLNKRYAVTGFDKMPIKGSASDYITAKMYTKNDKLYDEKIFYTPNLRNLKVGDNFEMSLHISWEDAERISKIVIG